MHDPVLHIEGMSVDRGARRIIHSLDLRVAPGEVYALLGGNGAGKTTTLDALLGFVRPSAGKVSVAGLDPVRSPGEVKQLLAYLPENVALYPYLSGAENLRYFAALSGRKLGAPECAALLAAAGLDAAWHAQRTSKYSKGMRQKVGLAIAGVKSARALLLDEPTSGLDPAAANALALTIQATARAGTAILMASHDLFNVHQVADRIGILREGRLVAELPGRSHGLPDLERAYIAHVVGSGGGA